MSGIKSVSFFKINNFIIQLGMNKSIEFMVNNCNFPGMSISQIDISRNTIIDQRPGDKITFNDLSVSILCDEDLIAYKQIYDNIIQSVNPVTGKLNVFDSVFDCFLNLTTNKNNINHNLHFHNAFIKSVSDVTLETTSSEGESPNFTIDLAYSFYTFE